MNRLKKIIVLTLPLLFLGLIPLSLAVPPYPFPLFKGTEIYLLGDPVQTISSSDYSYVAHGFSTWDLWSEMSGQDKAFFMGKSLWFELETDPATFEGSLKCVTIGVPIFDLMIRLWWIQFKPGDLTPGTYAFTGRWYFDYALDWEETITVIVT